MRIARVVAAFWFILVLSGTSCAPAGASFMVVEDFEGLFPGPIDGQSSWVAEDSTSAVVTDPDRFDNQVLQVVTESTHLYREISLPDGVTRMLFFRIRYFEQVNLSFGLSELTQPYRNDHFDVELSLDNAPASLRVNDGGIYRALASLQPDLWYNCWVLVDNTTDVFRLWLHPRGSDDANPADLLTVEGQTEFSFRYESAEDLRTFFIKTGGGNGLHGSFLLDDLYLEDTGAENLGNPTANPTAVPTPEEGNATSLLRVMPVPSRGSATIILDAASGVPDGFWICDVLGRRIARLPAASTGSGVAHARWDGNDEAGRSVEAGVYYVIPAGTRNLPAEPIVLVR